MIVAARKLIEHRVATLVGQRVFGIALGCEDINDHDELRRDPVMAVLVRAARAPALIAAKLQLATIRTSVASQIAAVLASRGAPGITGSWA
jgi:hypothetical protein